MRHNLDFEHINLKQLLQSCTKHIFITQTSNLFLFENVIYYFFVIKIETFHYGTNLEKVRITDRPGKNNQKISHNSDRVSKT